MLAPLSGSSFYHLLPCEFQGRVMGTVPMTRPHDTLNNQEGSKKERPLVSSLAVHYRSTANLYNKREGIA